MDFIRKYFFVIVAFVVGWAVGLFIFGWWLTPVEYVWTANATPNDLALQYQAQYINTTAIAFAQTNNPQVVTNAFNGWSDPYAAICGAIPTAPDQATINTYNQMAIIVSGQDCSAAVTTPGGTTQPTTPPAEEGGGNGLIILLIIVLIVLAVGIILVLRMRSSVGDDEGPSTYYDMPEAGPISTEEVNAIPLARFPSNYTYGRDNFDDSHSIENTNGDFLGECGVGIAESIGTDSPKNVTAFEVWLFDKNDIRTVTKVIMSDHAFYDDAIKAKLAPKGEPVLASEGEVIVLETAALIINAEIKEMRYGEGGSLPPQSYFEMFTIELSAWAKSSDAAVTANVQAQDDDLLAY
ncbi:MAG: hypothetical protein HND44_03620 [Chloroflexi bacterium]|nr:hypothetical protein [Ardenticatenaceae bacterium]MBL1127588.1 hypothetical protein [Chloroflexota bacterium]NOG33653.1 hypothetical protein [Chloroflexota bacterium]GIK56611.1 MAG: hypothetical protein BroJett015_22740 [Chloroflexota bacterium]